MPKITFKCPESIKHKEVVSYIRAVVKKLDEDGSLSVTDFPQLRRMATAYDQYLKCEDWLKDNEPTMKNLKGEAVKHPMVNIMRENWNQFLELAKEYGFTMKSRSSMKQGSTTGDGDSPLEQFVKNNK